MASHCILPHFRLGREALPSGIAMRCEKRRRPELQLGSRSDFALLLKVSIFRSKPRRASSCAAKRRDALVSQVHETTDRSHFEVQSGDAARFGRYPDVMQGIYSHPARSQAKLRLEARGRARGSTRRRTCSPNEAARINFGGCNKQRSVLARRAGRIRPTWAPATISKAAGQMRRLGLHARCWR